MTLPTLILSPVRLIAALIRRLGEGPGGAGAFVKLPDNPSDWSGLVTPTLVDIDFVEAGDPHIINRVFLVSSLDPDREAALKAALAKPLLYRRDAVRSARRRAYP